MLPTQITKRKWNYPAIAFLIPTVSMLMLMLIGGYSPFGKLSMLYSDMYHQYYPFFLSFRRSLVSGQSLMYTWDVGMGMDFLGLASYYLASPLNLLSVLVPEKWLLGYFSLLVPIKLGLASLFFAIMLKKLFGRYDFSICVFGAFYGMCAWALGYQWNVMWLDTFALLPLVALGTVQLLRDKKCILYTVSLFLSVAINYYIGLFTCFFVLLLFFCYEICRWKGFARFFADLGRIALFSVLAIGMTLFLELPALAALKNTQSSVNKFPTGFRLNIAKTHDFKGLLDGMRQVAGNASGALEPTFKEGLPNVYCGVGMLLLSFLFLTGKEIKLRDKLCCVFMLLFLMLSFLIRQLDYIWHGFHFTNMIPYRFSFLYSFVVLYMAYRAWLIRGSFKLWQLIVGAVLSIGIFACSDERKDVLFLAFNLGLLAMYLISMIYGLDTPKWKREAAAAAKDRKSAISRAAAIKRQRYLEEQQAQRKRISTGLLAGIAVVEIILNMVNFGVRFPPTNASDYPRGTDAAASIIRYMKEREEDNLFYRAETTHTQTLNDGALNGYYGITTFTSSANVKVTEFMKKLGYGAKNTYNRYCFEIGSPVANLFLGLKYMIERDTKPIPNRYFDQVHYNGKVYLLENNAYLPLGFMAKDSLAQVNFATNVNCLDFQNELLTAATGIGSNAWSFIPAANLVITGEKTDVTEQSTLGSVKYSKAVSGSAVVYTYTVHKDGFMCINLDLSARNNYTVSVNGSQRYSESISLPQLIAVGDVSAGDTVTVRVKRKNEDSGSITILAAVMDDGVFRQAYAELAQSPFQVTSFKSTRVEGTVSCKQDGLLYTSIPQDGNWSVTVDGKPADITLVGDVMVGVKLLQGEHNVVFRYRNSAFSLGWKLSLGCAIVFAGLVWLYERDSRKKGKFEQPE